MADSTLAFNILTRYRDAGARAAARDMDHLGNSADRAGTKTSGFGKKLKSVAKMGAAAAAAGLLIVGAAIVKWGVDSLNSLKRIEQLNAQTTAVIKSTGGAAGVTAKHIENLSSKLEKMTQTEAESTQEGANLLLTFTNIQNKVGKGNKIFDEATTTLVDMSRAMGNDPKTAAIQLGKALNDPIKGITALTRVGVSFTDGQKTMITKMVESGNTMGAQKIILAELNKEFGGSGKAFAATTTGKIEAAKNAFGDLGETLFSKLLPPLGELAAVASKGLAWLDGFAQDMQSGTGAGGRFADKLNEVRAVLEEKVWPIFRKVGGFIRDDLIPVVRDLADKYLDGLRGMFDEVSGSGKDLRPTLTLLSAAMRGIWKVLTSVMFPALGKWYGFFLPEIGKGIRRTITVIGWMSRAIIMMWNSAGQPVMVAFVKAIGLVLTAFGKMLQVVSSIPGAPAWIGRTADALLRAAKQADAVANSIRKIPTTKRVDITIITHSQHINPGDTSGEFGPRNPEKPATKKTGRAIVDDIVDGIKSKKADLVKGVDLVTDLLKAQAGKIKDRIHLTPAGVAIMDGLIKGIDSKKIELTRVLDKVTGFIKAQAAKIKSLVSDRASFAAGFSSFTSSAFGQDFTDPETGANNASVSGLIDYQKAQKAKAEQLKADVKRLVKMGLSKDLIQQLAASGEQGIAQIHALAGGSSADVAQLNALNASTNAALTAAGMAGGNELYGDKIADAQKAKATAEAIARELRKYLDDRDKNTQVVLQLDGHTVHVSLLREKRRTGKNLGLT